MTDLNELQYFVRVCETQSFTLAAKRLGIPKSTVSRGIARLENRLGVRLLQRTTRRVILTEEGSTYLEHARRALEEADNAERALNMLGQHPRGWLRIAAPTMFAHSFLGSALSNFLERYPELRLHLCIHDETNQLNPLQTSMDLVIQTGPIEDSELLVKYLGIGPRGIYASPVYLNQHGTPDSPSSLRRHSCLTRGESGPDATLRLVSPDGQVEAVLVKPRMAVADPLLRQQFVLSGLGIAVLPESICRSFEEQGQLVRVLRDWTAEGMSLYAVYPTRISQSSKIRAFFDWVDERHASQALKVASGTGLKPGRRGKKSILASQSVADVRSARPL